MPSATTPGSLEPAFFQLDLTSEVLISLGPTGLPNPCLTAGDYTLQATYSTDETQADDLGGISAFGGFQLGGGGPVADVVTDMGQGYPTFRQRFLNVLADSGSGLGIERGHNAGGATNGLKLSVGSGAARLSYEVRARQDFGTPNQAFAATSLSPLALPGAPVLGASLLLGPDALFLATSALTAVAAVPVVEVDPDLFFGPEGLADFATPFGAGSPVILSIPALAAGLDVYSQGLVLRLDTLAAAHTNRVRTSFLP